MAHIKIKGRWYLEEDLTDKDRIRLGVMRAKDFDEKEILKELSETPESVKKSPAKKRKKGKNIMAGKVVIGKPTLGEIEKGD